MSETYPWRREMRIFEFCISHAKQIIVELESSGGDHYEDVKDLQGLIETWELLWNIANEALQNEKYHKDPSTETKGHT